LTLPKVVMDTAGLLGQTALPLGLLAVGAGLALKVGAEQAKALVLSGSAKLLLLPLMAWGLCGWVQAAPEVTRIAVMFAALPTASSAYILAREMGGDHQSMAAIITLQTLLSMLSLPWLVGLAG
jgi:predicted permease